MLTGPYQQDALPRHPAYRQQGPAVQPAVVGAVHLPTDAEVGDLDREVVTNEAVTRREVAMHQIEALQVLHAERDLAGHVDQAAVAEHENMGLDGHRLVL